MTTRGWALVILLFGGALAALGASRLMSSESPAREERAEAVVGLLVAEPPLRGSAAEPIELNVRVSYPESMGEDATSIVSAHLESPGLAIELDDARAVRLDASAFEVSPKGSIGKPAGTSLPTEYRWTISPRQAGSHKLLLDLEDLARADAGETVKILVNDRIRGERDSQLVLDVDVATTLGMGTKTKAALDLLGTFLGAAGGLASLGGLYKWLKGRAQGGSTARVDKTDETSV